MKAARPSLETRVDDLSRKYRDRCLDLREELDDMEMKQSDRTRKKIEVQILKEVRSDLKEIGVGT